MVAEIIKLVIKYMKKTIALTFSFVLLLIAGFFLFRWNQHLVNNRPENLCRAASGGWAPAFMDSGELSTCDGKRLSKDSPLIDKDGFTCYCHAEDTCWNGEACVSVKK